MALRPFVFRVFSRSHVSSPFLTSTSPHSWTINQNRSRIGIRSFCSQEELPKVKEEEISDKVKDVADRILKLDLISWCKCVEILKQQTGFDPMSVLSGAGGGGASSEGATQAKAAEQVVDTGFRKIVIREYVDGNLPVKDKFSIMKLMREEQPDLSLADVIIKLRLLFHFKISHSF